MKYQLLLIIIFQGLLSNAQTECPFNQKLFSGDITIADIGASETKASDATNNHRFGERVAIDGDIAVVASRSNGAAAGKIFVFINDGSGNWTEQTILTASDGFAGDNFGSDIALEGNYLIVGARDQLNASDVDTGAAYLFEYNGVDTWTEVAVFEPSDGTTNYRFGESVDIAGDMVIVGARNGCTGGCAYIYENDGTNTFTYTETKLEPQVQSGYDGARFGNEVKIKDGRAYVSGPYDYSSVGKASAGSVQIWDQANDGSWSRTHRLRGTETSESFGWAIDIEGDYLAIGAMNFETSTTTEADQGRVFVYKADSNGDYLEANRVMIQNDDKDSFTDQRFGTDVVLEDGYLYVGTWGDGSINGDAVYIFQDDGTNSWTQIAKITSGASWDEFANRAVAVDFPNLLIGQNEADSPNNSGSVYFVSLISNIQPTASIEEVNSTSKGLSNGIIRVNFEDEATETQIKFSVDNGVTYPYVFNDDLATADITNLGQGNYDVWVAFDENTCPIYLGAHVVNEATYTDIPDANFEAALGTLGYDDISGDGQVPTEMISTVTTLDLDGKNISDLTGIEDFVELEELDADNNSLSSINVSTLSSLRVLRLNYNSLSSLDVTNNTNLETLTFRNNSVTAIDVSNNAQLKTLYFQFNDVAALDVTNNTALTSIICRGNNLTSIDLSQNTALTSFWAGDNFFTDIDLSNNSLLTVVQLYNNNLTNLNLKNGNNGIISNFSLTGNTNLSCILVDDAAYATTNWTNIDEHMSFNDTACTQYTAIPDANFEAALENLGLDDISGDGLVPTALIEVVATLNVNDNNISDLTGIQDFIALTELNCVNNILTTLDLSSNTNLSTLRCNLNNLTSLNISGCTLLSDLRCSSNELTSLNVTNNIQLTELSCGDNQLTSINLSNNLLLDNLTISDNLFTTLDLSNNTALEFFNFFGNSFTSIDLSNNTILNMVDLGENPMTSIDLSNNLVLTELYAYDGNITGDFDLSNHPFLIDVDFTNNDLTSLDIRNGNNTNIGFFDTRGNNNLNCISVDDAEYSTTTWTNIDPGHAFSEGDYCRYTTIPDANFEAWLENNGYDDISNDGQVPTALIEAVTSVSASFENINDFTGIEDFTALESLTVSYNSFTVLDVSNNLNLKFLNCGYSSLSSLDVSNNTLLETLWVNNTDVTSLDLSLNTNLTSLTASSMSNLTELNVKNGNNSNFTEFTTVASSNLSCIMVDDVAYSDTNWTNIESGTSFTENYCNYTAIPDANFEAALEALGYDDISDDGQVPTALIEVINTLHVSDENISNLTGIEDFTALVDLNVQNNSLSSLDLSNNLLLEDLNCASNKFFYLDLSNNVVLNSLYANNGWLVELNVSGNPQLEYLYLADNAFLNSLNYQNGNNTNNQLFNTTGSSNLNCIVVDDAVYSSTNWTNIETGTSFTDTYCEYTAIPDANFEAALDALGYDDISSDGQVPTALIETVTILDISSEGIADLTGIEAFEALDALDGSNNQLTEVDFGSNVPLTYLDLSSNNLTSLEAPTSVVNLVVNSNNLVYLDLTSHIDLQELSANSNDLIYVNLQNGANTNIYNLITTDNAELNCIIVDDVAYSEANLSNNIDITTSFSTTYCRYTQIPDANFEAHLENSGLDDVSGDGQVPTALIIDQESLNVSFSNSGAIYDLTGIQDFHELYNLILTDNLMTTVDLSVNVKLGLLTANNTALTSVDLSSNVNMNYINLSDCDDLTSVNIQNGNNSKLTGDSSFTATNVPNLSCVLVDDESYANATWVNYIDPQISYSETYCNYTAIPDANFEARLENLGYDDISGDGQVPTALIEVVTDLDVSSKNISDLTGIEDFIALLDLDCEVNSITSLDLSNNTLLETIDCDSNDLTLLDFGNNTVLKTLICNKNTSLGTLDLSNNIGLEYIQLTNNGLTSIDVNGLTALTTLSVDNNDLTAIGVSTTTALEIFTCANNTISSLDLSNNTNLTYILVSNNSLTNVDVTNSTALEYLYCSNNTGLTTLDVTNNTSLLRLTASNNSLSTIDVGNNVLLEKLWITDNEISNLSVDKNTVLTELVCYNNEISTLDVSNNTLLDWLYCDGNNLTNLDLTANTALTSFNCSNNVLTSLNLQNGNNTSLTFTVFTDNPNLTCILVDDAAYATANWTNVDLQTVFNETSCTTSIKIAPRVLLQGAMLNPVAGEESWMRDDLRINGYLPGSTPYTDGATIDEGVGGDDNGGDSTVDWIWVELRDATDPSIVIDGQSAVLQRDGDIVDTDGISELSFEQPDGSYYIAIMHRNHLGIMTGTTVSLSQTITTVDFTDGSMSTYGTNAQTTIGMPTGVFAMWAGDAEGNGDVNFGFDGNNILLDLLLHPDNTTYNSSFTLANGYLDADIDLSGNISFQDEYNNLLFNVLLYPSNTSFSSSYALLTAQLPVELTDKLVPNSKKLSSLTRAYIQQMLDKIQSQINK